MFSLLQCFSFFGIFVNLLSFLSPCQVLYSHPKYPSLLLYDDPACQNSNNKRAWRYCRRQSSDFLRFAEIVLTYSGYVAEVRSITPGCLITTDNFCFF